MLNYFFCYNTAMIKDANYYKTLIIDEFFNDLNVDLLVTEIPYLYGNRKADLVVIQDNKSIAFEIKSELDNLTKLKEQIRDYQEAFNEVYVVIADKFKTSQEIKNLPKNIGLIIEKNETFKVKRTAKIKTMLKKDKTVYFLHKNEMLEYLNTKKYLSINAVRKKFLNKFNNKEVYHIVLTSLINRYNDKFKLFCFDRGKYTHKEDLKVLTGLKQGLSLF